MLWRRSWLRLKLGVEVEGRQSRSRLGRRPERTPANGQATLSTFPLDPPHQFNLAQDHRHDNAIALDLQHSSISYSIWSI